MAYDPDSESALLPESAETTVDGVGSAQTDGRHSHSDGAPTATEHPPNEIAWYRTDGVVQTVMAHAVSRQSQSLIETGVPSGIMSTATSCICDADPPNCTSREYTKRVRR